MLMMFNLLSNIMDYIYVIVILKIHLLSTYNQLYLITQNNNSTKLTHQLLSFYTIWVLKLHQLWECMVSIVEK